MSSPLPLPSPFPSKPSNDPDIPAESNSLGSVNNGSSIGISVISSIFAVSLSITSLSLFSIVVVWLELFLADEPRSKGIESSKASIIKRL